MARRSGPVAVCWMAPALDCQSPLRMRQLGKFVIFPSFVLGTSGDGPEDKVLDEVLDKVGDESKRSCSPWVTFRSLYSDWVSQVPRPNAPCGGTATGAAACSWTGRTTSPRFSENIFWT